MIANISDRVLALRCVPDPLFRGLFLVCFFFSCYGVDLYIWKRCEVNYRRIFDVGYEHNYHSVVRASFGAITHVFFCFVLYILTLTSHLTPNKHVWPLLAIAGALVALFWPLDWMPEWKDRKQRYLLLHTLMQVVLSPLSRVTFARTFMADVLTSMPKIYSDFLSTVCMLGTGEAFRVAWNKDAKVP